MATGTKKTADTNVRNAAALRRVFHPWGRDRPIPSAEPADADDPRGRRKRLRGS